MNAEFQRIARRDKKAFLSDHCKETEKKKKKNGKETIEWERLEISSREGNVSPLQYSCLENLRDGGAWRAAIYGITQSQT